MKTTSTRRPLARALFVAVALTATLAGLTGCPKSKGGYFRAGPTQSATSTHAVANR